MDAFISLNFFWKEEIMPLEIPLMKSESVGDLRRPKVLKNRI